MASGKGLCAPHKKTITNGSNRPSKFYSSLAFWDPRQTKQSKDAVDVDEGEPIESVLLEKPTATEEDTFVPQDCVYETPAALQDLPRSPIMNDKTWELWWNWVAKKDRTPHWDKLSKLEREVLKNPYAYALATPLRQDFVTKFRFPAFFLQRFTLYNHPEGGPPWFLPADLKTDTGTSRSLGQGRHTIATYENLRSLHDTKKKGRGDPAWHAAKANLPRGEYIWRQGMAAHVHEGLKNRLYRELDDLPCRQCLISAAKEEGSWQEKSVGCILIWPGWLESDISKAFKKSKSRETSSLPMGHDSKTGKPIFPIKPVDMEDDGEVMTIATLRTGKKVPCYFMGRLLSDEKAEKLHKRLKIQTNVFRSALMTSVKSVNARIWLMKMAMYAQEVERVKNKCEGRARSTSSPRPEPKNESD